MLAPTPVSLPNMCCFQDTMVHSGPNKVVLLNMGFIHAAVLAQWWQPSQAHLLLCGYCTDSAVVTSPCPISAALNHSGSY